MNKAFYKICSVFLVFTCIFSINIREVRANEFDSWVEEKTEAGTYPLTVQHVDEHGNTVKKEINVTVLFPYSIENKAANEAIDAHDFFYLVGTLEKMSKEELVELAGAHAWNTQTGSNILIENVTVEPQEGDTGISIVTYTTKNDTRVAVNAVATTSLSLPLKETYINPRQIWENSYLFTFGNILIIILFTIISALIIHFYNYIQLRKIRILLYYED